MKILSGQSISSEVVVGRLQFCIRPPHLLSAFSSLSSATEIRRFEEARKETIRQLQEQYRTAKEMVGEEYASIFNIYAMIAEDWNYGETVRSFIKSQDVTAEYAALLAGENFARVFVAMEDDYMSARAADIRNVANQLVNVLIDYEEPSPLGQEPAILVDDEFSPGRLLRFDREKVLGVVARQGNARSHAAELARALGIPALVRVSSELSTQWDGHLAILNGAENKLVLDPAPGMLARMERDRWRNHKEPVLV